MDYHSDRFVDHSLLVFNEKNDLICCFPANETRDGEIISHGGLTYGSFILKKDIKLILTLALIREVLKYYFSRNFLTLKFKALPKFYNTLFSDEIDFALFLLEAKLYCRDTAIAINLNDQLKIAGNIKREANKAAREGMIVCESDEFAIFWKDVLIPNLMERYGVAPVHSVDEILLLKHSFRENIKFFVVKDDDQKIVAGTVLYLNSPVAHCQYIGASRQGRKSGALNLLMLKLIEKMHQQYDYFDLGIVNQNDGKGINTGMLGWKERLGGRTIAHDFYDIRTENYYLLDEKF